ncbi:MAG: tyrosine-type recombinase/integrase [Clostridium sp.]|nr:tyrosine-type recombinase/integrase [Clostridium sp.]
MIDLAYVQEQIEMKKRDELLHKHPYKIYQGKDGKWYTYLPDDEKGRIFKKRNTKESIESLVIAYWKEKETNPTINDIFREWIADKISRQEISKSTKGRYERQYEQCFAEFGKRNIKSISEYDIEDFLLSSISSYSLTRKGFSNLRTLIFGIFRLAKKKHYITYSITEIVNDIEISRKSFRKIIKEDDEQVFMLDEIPKITGYLEQNQDMLNLGILLLFKTGLRIGELAALKNCDIHGNVIHVNRTEICYEEENGNRVYEVRDFPKTEAGIRDVVIPSNCQWILKRIKLLNPFGEFLFMRNGERIRTYVFRNRLSTVCRHADVKRKSPHKIRKTYGSILLDDGLAESLIVSQMGHTNIKTTKEHYYKNRRNVAQIMSELDKVTAL